MRRKINEFEKKVLLSKDEYAFLLKSVFSQTEEIVQKNYYYDNNDCFFNRNNITCRIRDVSGKYTLTIKEHSTTLTSNSTEDSMCVNGVGNTISYNGVYASLKGELITKRRTLNANSHVRLMLDENNYLGETDYELEIEYDIGLENLANYEMKEIAYLLSVNNITVDNGEFINRTNTSKSKSRRFFERKELIEQRNKYGIYSE